MEDVLGRFYLEASETTRACELNQQQYDGYTPDQLRSELEGIASKQVKEWDAFSSPFVPDSPTLDGIRKIIDNCVACLEKFRATPNAIVPPWPRESGK
jgi:hypothetical protein